MKRTPLQRKARLRPGKPPSRATRLRTRKTGGLRPNARRKARRFLEQYGGPDGEHHVFVRADGCVVGTLCWGPIQASHYPSRGAGGKWHDLHGLCLYHHRRLHDWGAETFQQSHGLDLRAENRRLVVEHYGEAAT